MKTAGVVAAALLALCAGATASPAGSDDLERYSGTVVTVDRMRDVLIVDEMGRWDPATERARVTRRWIHVTGLTDYKAFVRGNPPGGYRGEFAEVPLGVAQLAPGDIVTAECVRAGRALVAMRVTVAEAP
jgi:hypothetical protein